MAVFKAEAAAIRVVGYLGLDVVEFALPEIVVAAKCVAHTAFIVVPVAGGSTNLDRKSTRLNSSHG